MGLFDIFKKKAKSTLEQVAKDGLAQTADLPKATSQGQNMPSSGPTFTWQDDTYPIPAKWAGLSIDEWFYKHESIRERLMHADEEDIEPMYDKDGDALGPEEVLLIKEYGFQNGSHWESYQNWAISKWAANTGESYTDVAMRMGGIAREKIMAEKARPLSGAGGALEPVEGVSVEQWAQMHAQIAGGADADSLIAKSGMDRTKWDRVSAEWTARMQKDTSMSIANVYGNAFAGAAQGKFGAQAARAAVVGVSGDLGKEPVSFERYVEIMVAQSIAGEKGEDANAVLASFGINALDWSNMSMYWSKRQQQEAEKYHKLYLEYDTKFKAKYGG
jgi:hypothetical protein